jgi:hypothetical protein
MDDLIKKYLYDILEAIAFIKEALEEIEGFSYYQSHKLYKPSTERKLGIIGEAVNKANQIKPDLPAPRPIPRSDDSQTGFFTSPPAPLLEKRSGGRRV